MFAAISTIAIAVADHLSSLAQCDSAGPGCNGRTYRPAIRLEGDDREIRRTYRDERDLARQIAALDEEFDPSRLTVVIVVDERTRQTFTAETIRREAPALRLAIAANCGAGPARDFGGDLSARAHSLGWRQIVCDRDGDRAVRESLASTLEGEGCVVFRPW
jgi:hypothetical protein